MSRHGQNMIICIEKLYEGLKKMKLSRTRNLKKRNIRQNFGTCFIITSKLKFKNPDARILNLYSINNQSVVFFFFSFRKLTPGAQQCNSDMDNSYASLTLQSHVSQSHKPYFSTYNLLVQLLLNYSVIALLFNSCG